MDTQEHSFIRSLQLEWICPISRTKMHDPVITADGNTYERQAITQWLQNEIKSPITNLPLQNTTLISNLAFKNLTQKLYSELPVFLDKQESLKTEVEQLKQEIYYLKNQLKHQKEQIQELNERDEREFKTKKIEKERHENKNEQINLLREQKNRLQKQIQSLRSIEQQQARQIKSLKDQLNSFTERYTKAAAGEKEFKELYQKIDQNRSKVLSKLEHSFVANFTFIAHLLNSIEEAKKFESEQKKIKSLSKETIELNGSFTYLSQGSQSKRIIEKLEEIIKETVNKAEKQDRFVGNRLFGPMRSSNALRIRLLGHQPNNVFNQMQRDGQPNRQNIFGQRPPGQNVFHQRLGGNPHPSRNIFLRAEIERRNNAQNVVRAIRTEPSNNIFSQQRPEDTVPSTSANIFHRPQGENPNRTFVHSPQSMRPNIFCRQHGEAQNFSRINIFGNPSGIPSPFVNRQRQQGVQNPSQIEGRRVFWGNLLRTSSLTQENGQQAQQSIQQPSQSQQNQPIEQQQPDQQESQPQQEQPVPQPQERVNSQQQQIVPSQPQPQQLQNIQEEQEESSLYKQLLTIKWMMSKRKYNEIPQFYNYQVCPNHDEPETYWFGVHVSVLESHIPFNEYFTHYWNHIRWLDLSSCGVDDTLWRKFIDSSDNFKHLMFINANRNKIETVRKTDLEKFTFLVKFSILRNKLSSETSIPEVRKYIEEHPNVKVDFSDEQEEQRIRNLLVLND